MHIHILGICGTFMGGLALLARELGHEVTGSDSNVYPPMSTQLEEQGIRLQEGYDPAHLQPAPDLVVIGNALSRGNPAVEYVLERGLRYISGPQWLSEHLLQGRWVLACAGTHGKTTTSSMLAWILEDCGYQPGFLIGGIPANFGLSARLGQSDFFVIEADEYDSAFFDKRSKFVHYQPRTLILNNLEFDHADIFDDLAAIQRQFHHLLRIVPANGRILAPAGDEALAAVIAMGCWSELSYFEAGGGDTWEWGVKRSGEDGSAFEVLHQGKVAGSVRWSLGGAHNIHNGLAAIAAAHHVGVPVAAAAESLGRFDGVKRRMELLGEVAGIRVYDDFAHHPTAIATTLEGLRASVGKQRIVALIEPRSNTMRTGVHQQRLAVSTEQADEVLWLQPPDVPPFLDEVVADSGGRARVHDSVEAIIDDLGVSLRAGDQLVIMSNGGFGGIHQRLLQRLRQRTEAVEL